jgi:hypothetical protein
MLIFILTVCFTHQGTALDEAGNFNNDLENNIEELCRRLEGRCLQEKEQETLLLQ